MDLLSNHTSFKRFRLHRVLIGCFWIATVAIMFSGSILIAQDENSADNSANSANEDEQVQQITDGGDEEVENLTAPEKVEIDPTAEDTEIEDRLLRILQATEWFENEKVTVDEGVVFLNGTTGTDDHRKWAAQLASNTQDVVAVVNRIQVRQKSIWDMSPAWKEVDKLGRETIQSLPMLMITALILLLTWPFTLVASRLSRFLLGRRIGSKLLVDVASRTITIMAWVVGSYLALRVSGLTQVAATLVGGTGLIGLIVGIAFRDIAENFLASILISIQRPFALGDVIELESVTGSVQSVTMHGTVLMTMDGNHVQMPNSVVYKTTIRNLTTNPNIRINFSLGIGYDDSISLAQDTILRVLEEHSAVLATPEPIVLVDNLGSSTVNLTVFFWIDAIKHSKPKVKSSLIRKVKQAVESAGISMPDEAREIIVPQPIPVQMLSEKEGPSAKVNGKSVQRVELQSTVSQVNQDDEQESSVAEGGLDSELADIEQQARASRPMESGANLLAN